MRTIPEDTYPQKYHLVTLVCCCLNGEMEDPEEVKAMYENTRWGSTSVLSVESKVVEGFHDDHPLNKCDTFEAEVRKLFAVVPAAALKRLVEAAQSKVETCRRCGGVGKIHLFQTDGFSDGTENCPSCHNFRLALSEWKNREKNG